MTMLAFSLWGCSWVLHFRFTILFKDPYWLLLQPSANRRKWAQSWVDITRIANPNWTTCFSHFDLFVLNEQCNAPLLNFLRQNKNVCLLNVFFCWNLFIQDFYGFWAVSTIGTNPTMIEVSQKRKTPRFRFSFQRNSEGDWHWHVMWQQVIIRRIALEICINSLF